LLLINADSHKSDCIRKPESKGGHRCGQLVCVSVLQHEVRELFPAEVAHGRPQGWAGGFNVYQYTYTYIYIYISI